MVTRTRRFEWDAEKNRANIAQHRIDFGEAKRIFNHPTLDILDDRFDYGEMRTVSIGTTNGITLLVVVHTDRNNVTRIISARRAEKAEQKRYDRYFGS